MTRSKLLRLFVFAVLSLNAYYAAAYNTQSVNRLVAPVITPYQPFVYMGLSFIAPRETSAATSNTTINFAQDLSYNASIHDTSTSIKESLGFALILGYRASRDWASEFGIYDNGAREDDTAAVLAIRSTEAGESSNPRLVDTTVKQTGHTYDLDFSVLRFIQLGHSAFSGFLRLGGGYHLYNVSGISSTSIGSQQGPAGIFETAKNKIQSAGLVYGFGVQSDISQIFSTRLDYTVFDQSITSSGDKSSKFMLTMLLNF